MGRTSAVLGRASVWFDLLGSLAFLLGCGGAPAPARPATTTVHTHAGATVAGDSAELFEFPDATGSPLRVRTVPSALQPFFNQCALGDAGLSRVAERFARRKSQGKLPLDASEISFALRAEGSPYVWPRAWTLEGSDLVTASAVERLHAWLVGFGDGGQRRCGVALVEDHEHSVLATVAVDALADLAPLPVRARAGSWLDLSADLLVPASDAKWIVLGPSGPPFAIPTSFDGQHARGRFHADRPGAFLVQLLANVAGGPRPLLEATTYVEVPPPTSFFSDVAPGEPEAAPAANSPSAAAQALLEMVNLARASEQSPALIRNSELDAVAERHAQAMRQQQRIAHDVGDGDPRSRVEATHLEILATGENVAHTLDVVRAHRALWASPSHRENLLEPRFDAIGIGIALDPDGSLWVCEVFADFPDQRR